MVCCASLFVQLIALSIDENSMNRSISIEPDAIQKNMPLGVTSPNFRKGILSDSVNVFIQGDLSRLP